MMTAPETGGLRGEFRYDEPMSRHTSWRVGGPARIWYRPADLDDLCVFLSGMSPDEDLVWLGLGSNLLVRDGGIVGTVVSTLGALGGIGMHDQTTLRAEAGVTCAKVARFSANHALTGGEFLAGIPGTVGGALAMNAGAFGGETWNSVVAVETIDRHGTLHDRNPEDFHIGYRHVEGPGGEWFVAANFRFKQGNADESRNRIKALLARRGLTQPTQLPSCGSVFRNPPGDHAARLIEACGLKGYCIGGGCVSDKHANFIANTGDATAADIEALMTHVRSEVERQQGVRLQPEVRIVGEPGGDAA
jgi:UDP-N-acetylmuramate dehydrogenase